MVNPEGLGRSRTALLALTMLLMLSMAGEALLPLVVAAERQRSRSGVNAEVVGGQPVGQGTFRFMTVVLVDTGEGTALCGGSLIAARFVLTAAHCVVDEDDEPLPPGRFTLIVGRAVRSETGTGVVRGAVAVAPHPDYDPETSANDAAVLELSAAVPESVARPLAVVGGGETRFDGTGQPVVVAGWGRTVAGAPVTSNQLRAANLTVVSSASCDAAYEDFGGIIPAVMVCAAFQNRDSCQGDSGGPLFAREVIGFDVKKKKKKKGHKRKTVRIPIYRDVQMGIVSFGIGCALPEFPGVYTRLSNAEINAFIVEAIDP